MEEEEKEEEAWACRCRLLREKRAQNTIIKNTIIKTTIISHSRHHASLGLAANKLVVAANNNFRGLAANKKLPPTRSCTLKSLATQHVHGFLISRGITILGT